MVLYGLPTNLSVREQFDRDHLLKCDEVDLSIHVSWRNHIDRRIDAMMSLNVSQHFASRMKPGSLKTRAAEIECS